MGAYVHFSNYTPAADIVVAAICFVMIVLVVFSYISRTRSFKLFLSMVLLVLAAAWLDITFYTLARYPSCQVAANWVRCLYHAMLLLILVHYIAYMCEVSRYEKQRSFLLLANIVFALAMLADIVVTARGLSFVYDEAGIHFVRRGIFLYAFAGYSVMCLILLVKVRKLVFHRVMLGFYGTMSISIAVLLIQGLSNQSSFTVATLLLPVVAMMYVLHSNPYDAQLGSNDTAAMQSFVQYAYEKKRDFVFMSLYIRDFDEEGKKLPEEMQTTVREFTYKAAKNARLFKVGRGHMILIFLKRQYPYWEKKTQEICERFFPLYEHYRYDYKIVIGTSAEEISRKNEYVSYIRNIHRGMPECSIHRVGAEDVIAYKRNEYILKELADIHHGADLDDPRVLVYCQPVLNVKTGRYDTAEALMRMQLKELGLIFPNQFIPLAEEQGYIHTLTRIILHKTCLAIRQLTDAQYDIRRISVNISVPELKDEGFCADILDIIRQSGVPGDKIAIELTESQNEGDFMLMKQKIEELRQYGIKFYLDDFGTGYSNMERIMELPFDIIKFDRSLVIASGAEDRSRRMVANLANMFSDMDYSVLYEGVEKDADEIMCKGMSAAYLQGYKYSRPTPIVKLQDYLSRDAG